MASTKPTKATVKYDVPEEEFGKVLKCSIYLTHEALLNAFGHLPKKIRIMVVEEP
jgi:hypothetical protein